MSDRDQDELVGQLLGVAMARNEVVDPDTLRQMAKVVTALGFRRTVTPEQIEGCAQMLAFSSDSSWAELDTRGSWVATARAAARYFGLTVDGAE